MSSLLLSCNIGEFTHKKLHKKLSKRVTDTY